MIFFRLFGRRRCNVALFVVYMSRVFLCQHLLQKPLYNWKTSWGVSYLKCYPECLSSLTAPFFWSITLFTGITGIHLPHLLQKPLYNWKTFWGVSYLKCYPECLSSLTAPFFCSITLFTGTTGIPLPLSMSSDFSVVPSWSNLVWEDRSFSAFFVGQQCLSVSSPIYIDSSLSNMASSQFPDRCSLCCGAGLPFGLCILWLFGIYFPFWYVAPRKIW
jgi:hypothetical protein